MPAGFMSVLSLCKASGGGTFVEDLNRMKIVRMYIFSPKKFRTNYFHYVRYGKLLPIRKTIHLFCS